MKRADEIRAAILCFFLSDYPVQSRPQYLEAVVRDYLGRDFNEDFVDKFWHEQGELVREELIAETNDRIETGASLRYDILDDIGEKLCGAGNASPPSDPRISFQDALQELDPLEFERLAGVLLQWAGCHATWLTPQSHDQGLDAFGYANFFAVGDKWPCARPEVIFLVQAKHYVKQRVSSYDLREFIGASECAKHRTYAVQGERYTDLDVRPFAPVALIFVTSGELKTTAKTHAQHSGMLVVASDELFELCDVYWRKQGIHVPKTKRSYLSRLRKEGHDLPIAY